MNLRGRQKVMFIVFAITLLIIMFLTAYLGNLNFLTSNLYLLLFLAALYLDKSYNSKYVLVLSTAVLLVNELLTILRYPGVLLYIDNIIRIISYVGLYFFAMEFLKGTFRSKDKSYLIIGLTVPYVVVVIINIINMLIFGQITLTILGMVSLAGILLELVFPASIIYYTISRLKNRFDSYE